MAAARPAGWAGVAGLLPAAGYVVLLTLGQMPAVPAAHAWVPDLAEDGRIGLYTGALSSVSGLIVLIGSSATGSLLDLGLPLEVFGPASPSGRGPRRPQPSAFSRNDPGATGPGVGESPYDTADRHAVWS